MNAKKVKSALFIAILGTSLFLFCPTIILQQAFARTPTYDVTLIMYFNATGMSGSAMGDPEFRTVRVDISKSVDLSNNLLQAQGVNTTPFTPGYDNEFLGFTDLTAPLSPRGTKTLGSGDAQIVVTAATERYVMRQYDNGTVTLNNASAWLTAFPTSPTGAPVREATIVFNSPQTYALAYCDANGYTYQNMINVTYERDYSISTLNTYHSEFLYEGVALLRGSETSQANVSALGLNAQQRQAELWLYNIAWTHSVAVAGIASNSPQLPPEQGHVDAPDAEALAIMNITQTALERFGTSADLALAAYLNNSISLDDYLTIIQTLSAAYSTIVNNATLALQTIYESYLNSSEALYDKYTDAYDQYASGWALGYTDWFSVIVWLVIGIIVIAIIYKLVSKKKENIPPATPFVNYFS